MLSDLAGAQRADDRGRLPVHEHRRGPAPVRRPGRRRRVPVLAVRDGRRQAHVRVLRPARPQGRLRDERSRRRTTGRSSRTRAIESPPRTAKAVRRAHVRHHQADVDLHGRARRRPVRGVARRLTSTSDFRIPLGIYCRASLAPHMDHERLFTETKQGFEFYHRNFGVPYPFGKYDQCFVPEFNAGAMENAGCVTFLEDYVFRSRVTRYLYERRVRDRAARDGAHVVRRPRHHALVGRPVAERVVRHLGVGARAGRGHRVQAGVDDVREHREVLGVPAGPAALHPPGGGRHPGPAGGRGQLRRHHLRQGRFGAQAARRVRRAGELPGGAAGLLRQARLGQRHARRPARRAGGGVRARPVVVERAVAGDDRPEPVAPQVHR